MRGVIIGPAHRVLSLAGRMAPAAIATVS